MNKVLLLICMLIYSSFIFAQIPDGYYDGTEDLSGEELKTALNDIIKGHKTFPYTSGSTDVWDILKDSDRDPDNSENVILLYTGWSVDAAQEYNGGSGWNREHVWAKSHGDFGNNPPAGTDTHHLRPCDISVNSSRGNKDFDEGGVQNAYAPECYSTTTTWEPRDEVKGDVARMMFYMAARYEGDGGEPDLQLVDYTPTSGPLFGNLTTLMEWHNDDPVNEFELNRNEVIFSYQENRNPFIDHPEFVDLIWNAPPVDVLSKDFVDVKIYPNPCNGILNIATDNTYEHVVIYNVIGLKIMELNYTSIIDLRDVLAGQYLIQLQGKDQVKTLPLIVKSK